MSVQVPMFGTLPNSATMTESAFNAAWNNYFNTVDTYGAALNALGVEAEANAARAESAVASLADTVWVSGTVYTAGQSRYSPLDFLSYRRKTNGAGTIDPKLDPTNWELQTSTSLGGADTTGSATDITLTFTSGRLQVISMTAAGKKVLLPAATTIKKGTPVFVFKNSGAYRFSLHKNGGGFLCYVNPGQVIAVHCSDNGSAAGVWHVSGQAIDQVYGGNSAEVLNVVDSRYITVAMLSATQAICAFRNNSTTFLNAVVLNYGSASGSPAQVAAQTAKDISIAAQANNQATICYKTDTGTTRAVVLDISGSGFTPGTDKQIDSGTGGGGTALTALSPTQLLAFYQGAATTSPKMRVLDIVSSAITESSQVEADTSQCKDPYLVAGKVSATKVLLFFRNNSNSRLHLRLQSISGSTPAPTGSLLDLTAMTGTISSAQFGAAVLSASRAVTIVQPNLDRWEMMASLYDISGTSPVLIGSKFFNVGAGAPVQITAAALDANNIHVTWSGGASLGIDACRVTLSNDDQITVSPVSERTETGVATGNQYQAVAALNGTRVMQVCRNASTYLSAKTLEIA